jgi:hypothetical protein
VDNPQEPDNSLVYRICVGSRGVTEGLRRLSDLEDVLRAALMEVGDIKRELEHTDEAIRKEIKNEQENRSDLENV